MRVLSVLRLGIKQFGVVEAMDTLLRLLKDINGGKLTSLGGFRKVVRVVSVLPG